MNKNEIEKAVCTLILKGWAIITNPRIILGITDNNITIIRSPNVIVIFRIRCIPLCVLLYCAEVVPYSLCEFPSVANCVPTVG
jgi:hypothetical protein